MTVARGHGRHGETWIVTGWTDASAALQSTELAAEPQRRADPYLLGADGSDHAAIRAIYERALDAIALDTGSLARLALAELSARLARNHDAELHADLAAPLVELMIAAYLGVDRPTSGKLGRAARVAARIGAGERGVDARARDALADLDAGVAAAVDRRAPGTVPAHLHDAGLSLEIATSLTRLTVIGAAETTARLIVETAVQAMQRRDTPVRAGLVAHPPLRHVFRRACRDVAIAGTVIPAGALVLVELAGTPGAAFGHGPHRCPGRSDALAIAHAIARGWDKRIQIVELIYGASDDAQFGGPTVVRVVRDEAA